MMQQHTAECTILPQRSILQRLQALEKENKLLANSLQQIEKENVEVKQHLTEHLKVTA